MDKREIIERLKNIAKHAVHTVGEKPFVMSLDDGIAVNEAIELLKKPETNCSEIPNSSDVISRQAAIDALKEKVFRNLTDEFYGAMQVLDELPSAQPELKELSEWKADFKGYINDLNMPKDDYDGIMEYIDEVPSAQPERTCVNCGRTANNGGWYADGGTRCPIEEHYALPKDGYCHLWEKRNVTDDDYPERRTDE